MYEDYLINSVKFVICYFYPYCIISFDSAYHGNSEKDEILIEGIM